jgi:toxin CcdB
VEKLLMARFDVYNNPGSQDDTTPYLLDVQSNLLDGLESRLVIPLRRLEHFPRVKLSDNLTPVFTIKGQDFLLETPKMGAVPVRILKKPIISLASKHGQITAALDFLFQGY